MIRLQRKIGSSPNPTPNRWNSPDTLWGEEHRRILSTWTNIRFQPVWVSCPSIRDRKDLFPFVLVDIDESVVLPQSTFNLTDPKSNTSIQPSSNGLLRLPPIVKHARPPYGSEDLYRQSSDRYAQHFYSTHDHRCRKHRRRDESYDGRWWYMPLNSVHGPKRVPQYREHRYVPPKWYELPTRR